MFRWFRIIFAIIVVVVVLYGVLSVRIFRVDGDSMSPAFASGSIVITDRISSRIKLPKRGEVIVYRDKEMKVKVKRVIGLPGESLQIQNGAVFLGTGDTAQEILEPYLGEHIRTCVPGACTEIGSTSYTVPLGSYFVLGDNRENSRDSRGCPAVDNCGNKTPEYVPYEKIIGRVIFPQK